jgi:hypothetical protein
MKLAVPPSVPQAQAPPVPMVGLPEDLPAERSHLPTRACSPHHVGSFEGWNGFLALLLWATRANRRG